MRTFRASLAAALFSILITALPATAQTADAYAVNPQASLVGFTVYAQMLFKMGQEGRFKEFTGQVSYDPSHPANTKVDLTVYTATVDMKNAEHEALLRSGDFFDVDRFPTMRFVSADTSVRPDGSMAVTGDLTIRDVTKRVAIPVKINEANRSGEQGAVFETTFQIDRTEFGLNGTPKLGMNVSIAKNVRIHIAIAARPSTLGTR